MTDLIKITDLPTLDAPAAGDYVPIVDISDTTSGPGGTTKKVSKEKLKGLNWRGTWSTGTYVADDAVEKDGSAYVCTAASTTETPSGAAADWDLLASKGNTGATGATGAAGATGATGAAGANGKTVLYGTAAPTTEGVDGDFYIRTTTNFIYGPKAGGSWPAGTSLVGPTGPTGPAGSGSGDMLISVYDPSGKNGNAFNADNHVDGTTNKVFTATEKTKLAGVATGADVTSATNVGTSINGAAAKTTPVDADVFAMLDSAASNVLKKVTWANIKTTLASTFAALAGSISQAFSVATLEIGHASDTTLSRVSAGLAAIEGVTIALISTAQTLTNKRMQPRTNSTTSNATLAPDLSTANVYFRTTQTVGLTISAPIGTPVIGETLVFYIDSVGAQTLTMNATYKVFGAAFPASTTAGKTLMITAEFNGTDWKTLWANAV